MRLERVPEVCTVDVQRLTGDDIGAQLEMCVRRLVERGPQREVDAVRVSGRRELHPESAHRVGEPLVDVGEITDRAQPERASPPSSVVLNVPNT